MNSTPRTTDVFVVGGGPAGLAVALALRRHGCDVTVADRAFAPVDKACGEGIMPDGLAAARALGLDLERVPGHAFHGIRFCDAADAVSAAFPNGAGRGMRRTELHRYMVNAASDAGVRLAWGARIAGIRGERVDTAEGPVCARWIVGADGHHSAVRRWAGLEAAQRESRRFGFRRHFRIDHTGSLMELHWSDGCQLYLTPVAPGELCAVLISRDPHLRFDEALHRFPRAAARLAAARPVDHERGGVTVTRRLRAIARGNVALVGDASGSADAITGEGLCLVFQQSLALANAIAAGDLAPYEAAHRRIARRPSFMADFMLLLDGRRRLRARTIPALASRPRLFERMLAMHVGQLSLAGFLANGLALGWYMLAL